MLNTQGRRLAALDYTGRPFDRRSRVSRNDVADHQVIEKQFYGGQMLGVA